MHNVTMDFILYIHLICYNMEYINFTLIQFTEMLAVGTKLITTHLPKKLRSIIVPSEIFFFFFKDIIITSSLLLIG